MTATFKQILLRRLPLVINIVLTMPPSSSIALVLPQAETREQIPMP